VKPIVDDLKSQDFFVGNDLYVKILKLSGYLIINNPSVAKQFMHL
jgi:hypothetical protein